MPAYRMGSHAASTWGQSGFSNSSMAMRLSTPPTKNWMQLMRTPSTRGEKWSITRMWAVKNSAQSRHSTSPLFTPASPFMHRRYMPATASATPAHSAAPVLRPSSRPASGTSTIYSAVMNPALPTEV